MGGTIARRPRRKIIFLNISEAQECYALVLDEAECNRSLHAYGLPRNLTMDPDLIGMVIWDNPPIDSRTYL